MHKNQFPSILFVEGFFLSMKNRILTYSLLLLPIVIFYVYVNYYAINVGWNDDWHGIEGFLASWMQQDTLSDKLHLLFSQMCEHRILYVRLSTLLCYQLFGEANYKILMLMGVSYLLILPFVFYRVLREINLTAAYLIPIIFIVFNVQPIENIFWAITSLQPNVVIIFGLLAFCLLLFTKNAIYFYISAILCWIIMFTNGNGMFSFLAAIPIILYNRSKSERIQWFAIMALCFFWYFHDFKKPGIRPDVLINFTQFPHIIIADFFAFFGSPIDSTALVYNQTIKFTTAIFFGALMLFWCGLLFLLYLTPTTLLKDMGFQLPFFFREKIMFKSIKVKLLEHPKYNLFLLSSFIFVALSGAAFSASRASQGLNEAFNSRYKTVSIILFIICYLSAFNFLKPQYFKKYLNNSIIFTALFSVFSYYVSTDDVIVRRRFLATDMINWINNGRYYYYAFEEKSRYPDDHAPIKDYEKLPIPPYNYAGFVEGVMKYVNDILFISRKHFHNYNPPKELYGLNDVLFKNITPKTDSKEEVSVTEKRLQYDVVIKNAFIPFTDIYGGYYATVENDSTKLCFPLETQANKLTTFVSTQRYFNNIIIGQVPKPNIPSGKFKLRIGHVVENQFVVLYENAIEIK